MKYWKPAALGLALALLTGCPTPGKHGQAQRITPLVGETPVPEVPATPAIEIPAPPAVTNIAPAAPPVLATPPKLAPAFTNVVWPSDWVALEDWTRVAGLPRPQRVTSASALKYEVRHTNGTLTVTIGHPVARWNGLNLDLGFLPQFTNGQPVVHALDVTKNFGPLLASAPLPPRADRLIVIDPGHGGSNTGAKSSAGKGFEKDFTLDWAFRLRPLLEKQGWKVALTRTNDVDIALSNRVAFAEQARADFFLSLHFNSLKAPAAALEQEHGGIETYCLTPQGMPSSLTREFEDDRTRAHPNNAFDAQNLSYAVRLHQALLQTTYRRDRGVRRARFMTVLQTQNRPAVLLEAGYLTDAREARLISTGAYRQKLAEAVAKALAD